MCKISPNRTLNLPHLHMIEVPGGTFEMGSEEAYDDEMPVHTVTVSDFELGQYPVTQALWEAVMGAGSNPSRFEGPRRPVEQVSWYDAVAFCNRLNAAIGQNCCYFSDKQHTIPYALQGELPNAGAVYYQPTAGAFCLPTEAEWEYAARGGPFHTMMEYSGTDRVKDAGWYRENSGDETLVVGLLQPNVLGLCDMSGNVREWCWDWYADYTKKAETNPTGPSEGDFRVVRGGSWNDYFVRYLRVSFRDYFDPDFRDFNIGFRLARH